MKNTILILFILVLFVGCNKPSNKLTIVFSKTNPVDSVSTWIRFLQLKNQDSVVYKAFPLLRMSSGDTLKIDSLYNGDYILEFNNLIGERVRKNVSLNNNELKAVKIVFDSIPLDKFYSKIPFNHLKDNESYTIEGKGGCVATMYCHYIIEKQKGNYYFKSTNISNRLLKSEEIKAIKKFESELFAIEGRDVCFGTGRMTYKVVKNGTETHSITDNTCNWSGWSNMMFKLNINK